MAMHRNMGTTTPAWTRLAGRAAGALLATLVVHAAHAQASAPSPAPAPCETALSDRFPPGCPSDEAARLPDEATAPEADTSAAREHDALDDRPKQIETMNQQLRLERRRKDSLLHLYPDEAAHNAARLRALERTDKPIRAAEDRVEDLARERRRVGEATRIYAGKRLPSDLRNQSQHIDVALQEATATLRNCRDERVLVSKSYDEELVVLRRLWAAQRRS